MNTAGMPSFQWQSPDWLEFAGLVWPAELMNARLTDRLHVKQGRNIARWTLTRDQRELAVFVKRHEQHSFARTQLASLRPGQRWSDAGREWERLRWAADAGVAVPRVLAVAEWSGRRLQSSLVLEELTGMRPLHEAIPQAAKTLPPGDFTRWKRRLIREMVRVVRLLHDRGLFHQDLYLCHFYVHENDIRGDAPTLHGRLVLIDFHRLTRRRLLSLMPRAKDLGQLLFSADVEGVTRQDVALFWRLYGCERDSLLRRLVEWKAARYRRHNEKRRA